MPLPDDPAALVAHVMADPPAVHAGAPAGVWSTDLRCYELLASRLRPGMVTLETGCGVSTAIFAVRGTTHLCVMPYQNEADTVLSWCERHDVDHRSLRFEIGSSDVVLPRLEQTPLDVILVDGEHQFPIPVIDWYYTARRLAVGGLLVIDDVQLPGPRLVADYVESLASIDLVERTGKWAAYELARPVPPAEEWELPKAGAPLVPRGTAESIGRRVDGFAFRVRNRFRRGSS